MILIFFYKYVPYCQITHRELVGDNGRFIMNQFKEDLTNISTTKMTFTK